MIGDDDLRDLFAMFAMHGIVSRGISADIVATVAENAYIMADEMMEARNKETDYAKKGITAIRKRRPARKAD
jgi:hypothetical protein